MGCVVSTAIACLLCSNRCSVERLASKMAFHPPNPPSYTIDTQANGTCAVKFLHFELNQAQEMLGRSPVQVDVRLLMTQRKQRISLFHFIYPEAKVRRGTLVSKRTLASERMHTFRCRPPSCGRMRTPWTVARCTSSSSNLQSGFV